MPFEEAYLLFRLDVLIALDAAIVLLEAWLVLKGRQLAKQNAKFLRVAKTFGYLDDEREPATPVSRRMWTVRKK